MATDVFDYDYIKIAAALVYIPENATAYTENELILKIASHLYSTKLKKNKKYYVRVRAYKKVNGKNTYQSGLVKKV